MGDIAISIIAKIAEMLVEPAGDQIRYAFSYKDNIKKLIEKVEELKGAQESVKHGVEEAKRKRGEEIERRVDDWLRQVNAATEKADEVLKEEDIATNNCFMGLCPNFQTRYKLSQYAEKQTQACAKLLKEGNFDRLSYDEPYEQLITVKDYEAFESRKLVVEEIIQALLDPDVSLIGVHGFGGVGKSTLVKKVAAQVKDEKLFDAVVLAEVKQKPDLKGIQGEIADNLDFEFGNVETVVGRANRLRRQLKKQKKVLIVLDDVWEKIDLEKLGIPYGGDHQGCKVLMTSRTQNVLSVEMKIDREFRLEVLRIDEAWNLFQKIVGDAIKNPELQHIAPEVARRCAGLPVLIVAVANTVKLKELHAWEVALGELKSDSEYDLMGIDIVDKELKWVREIREKLQNEAMKVLQRGMEGLNQAKVSSGLQVFYNLGELKNTVEKLVNKYKEMGVKSVGVALEMKAILAGEEGSAGGGWFGPVGITGRGTVQIEGRVKAEEALWQRLGNCMDQMHSIVVSVWHLQRVLSSKRDSFTQVLLLDEVIKDGDSMLTDQAWDAFVKAFASQMKSAFTASSFVKEIFKMGYPKLFSIIENFLERISHDTDVIGALPAINQEQKDQMFSTIEIFQTDFLALCLSPLSDLVNTVFPVSSHGSVPSNERISRSISHVQEQIEAVQLHSRLSLLVLREVGKVLVVFAERAEYQISTGHKALQITGSATPAQIKNFMSCQHLQEIHTRISSMIIGLPPIAADVLSPSLCAIYGVACEAVTPLFQAMIDRLESCILQIHDENFGVTVTDSTMENNTSPYMEELQKCILHFRSEFLSRLLVPSSKSTTAGVETICTQLVRRMASRVLTFFIRHASLIRPLSESSKLRMARDMVELELTIGQNLFPVEQLGSSYRALRAFRPLIFLETSQLIASPLLQDFPPNVILHHLYSRGPDELQSPMQRNKLTPLQYSLWLDSQGENQIWKAIKASLDDYAAKIISTGDKEFDPVYLLMLQLGVPIERESLQISANLKNLEAEIRKRLHREKRNSE